MNTLRLHELECIRPEDAARDECRLEIHIDGVRRELLEERMVANQVWTLNKFYNFASEVKIALWDEDFPDRDDLLGEVTIGANLASRVETFFTQDQAHYRLRYSVTEPIKYVTDADGKGWLVVRWSEDNSTVPAIPQYLRLEYLRTANAREYFKVLEGLRAGKEASVRLKDNGQSYLVDGDPQLPAGTVTFNRRTGEFWYGSSGPISSTTDDQNPTPLGTFDLEIPDEVHVLGEGYLTESRFATTWFRIDHQGDRFLHPGRISAGCVTITDIPLWTDIYNYLIQRRRGDGRSVATITIVE